MVRLMCHFIVILFHIAHHFVIIDKITIKRKCEDNSYHRKFDQIIVF